MAAKRGSSATKNKVGAKKPGRPGGKATASKTSKGMRVTAEGPAAAAASLKDSLAVGDAAAALSTKGRAKAFGARQGDSPELKLALERFATFPKEVQGVIEQALGEVKKLGADVANVKDTVDTVWAKQEARKLSAGSSFLMAAAKGLFESIVKVGAELFLERIGLPKVL